MSHDERSKVALETLVFAFFWLLLVGPGSVAAQETRDAPDRSGFTLLLNLGVGYQNDAGIGEAATGLAGLNLGIGGFLNDDLALMFRFSGTNVEQAGYLNQVSGVAGPTLQYWPDDRLFVEIEYAPAFTDPGTVHNLGFVFGWQML